jgi:predicted regulator of Ras-like GTPase activity (Roadblock/LC7/MglB family)
MSTRQEQLITILDNLTSQTAPDVSGAVAVSMDGIVFASRLSNELKIGATDEAIARVL